MKQFLVIMLALVTMGASAGESTPSVKFEEGNFFAITSQFNRKLLDDFSEKLLSYDKKELFIYFDTPGGSVLALSSMVRLMKASDVKFTCVASFAASAGFMLFQHCDKRYLLSNGVLMSHNWSGSFSGEAPRILTLYNTINDLVATIESVAIQKMSVNKKEYAALINDNLWMTSRLATKYAAIDKVITKVSCSKDIIEQRVPTLGYSRRGGNSWVYKSGCPLIQKTYYKVKNNKRGRFVSSSSDLFSIAQKSYKKTNANWIYMGSK